MTISYNIKKSIRKILIRIFEKLPVTGNIIEEKRRIDAIVAEKELQNAQLQEKVTFLENRLAGIGIEETIVNLFQLLKGDHPDLFWAYFRREFAYHYDQFSQSLGDHLSPDEMLHMLSLLLIPIARNGLKDQDTATRLFYLAQSMDVHLLPVHFYSPIPQTTSIPDSNWLQRFDYGFDLNDRKQLEWIDSLSDYVAELHDIPADAPAFGSMVFHWNNPAFGPMDAAVYYALIRSLQPRRILEVGGGYSSLMAVRAARKCPGTIVDIIEPFPADFLREPNTGINRLMIEPVQSINLSEFESLDNGDFLFIDSTHISKSGSDVNWIILNILPRLKAGVFVHFHDITIPWDYPKEWVMNKRIFFNEQFLLMALLVDNPKYEIVLSNYYLGSEYSEELRKAFPLLNVWGGGSFWMKKTA